MSAPNRNSVGLRLLRDFSFLRVKQIVFRKKKQKILRKTMNFSKPHKINILYNFCGIFCRIVLQKRKTISVILIAGGVIEQL